MNNGLTNASCCHFCLKTLSNKHVSHFCTQLLDDSNVIIPGLLKIYFRETLCIPLVIEPLLAKRQSLN